MEIHALRVLLSEQDLNEVLGRELAENPRIKNARIRLLAEGLHLDGVVNAVFDFPFESRWVLDVREGKFAAQLAHLKAFGASVNILKNVLMRMIAEMVRNTEGVDIQADAVVVDVEQVIARKGIIAQVNLKAVVTMDGALVIEAGHP